MENTILKEFQLGAKENPETKSIDFKLYSKNETKVLLCIFDTPQGADPVMTLTMKKNEDDIWQTSVKNYVLNYPKSPVFYGYRVFGKNWEYLENFELGSEIGMK